jgi:hypothetical protein
MQLEQVHRQNMTVKSDENDENFFLFQYLIWLGFQIFVSFFKVDLQGPWGSD